MYLICGLGNPGREYEQTRHNMGFLTVDLLSQRLEIKVGKLKFRSLIGDGRIAAERVILMKPQTYMNRSGEALREIVSYYGIEPEKLIVIYDDVDLPVGELRLRKSGSAGTHNGMRSIIYQLQFDNFPRIRIGTGKSEIVPLVNYVTQRPDEDEIPLLVSAIEDAASACIMWIDEGADAAMRQFNRRAAECSLEEKCRESSKEELISEDGKEN